MIMVVFPGLVGCEPLVPLCTALFPQPLVKQDCLYCNQCACNASLMAQMMIKGQHCGVMLASFSGKKCNLISCSDIDSQKI